MEKPILYFIYLITVTLSILLFFIFSLQKTLAAYDPLSVPNNFYGIHILSPEEIDDAAKLVNSNGGDWGYVTIPIQAGDKDVQKWNLFMKKAKELHMIPIIRIATEEYFKKKGVWRIPDDYDIIDFANFLNSLDWPTTNRYVILFNELNRYDEWGGEYPDPAYYSDIVNFAYTAFKDRNKDFFIILGAFDNASITDYIKYMNGFEFMRKMRIQNEDIFNSIDGIASHSYPNPAFAQPPSGTKRVGISTYRFEYDFINSFASSKKPVFITETGWNAEALTEEKIGNYFKVSFENVWGKDSDKVVAITPFLLKSQGGIFDMFSFIKSDKPTTYFDTIQKLKKISGSPDISENHIEGKRILSVESETKSFDSIKKRPFGTIVIPELVKLYIKTIFAAD